MPSENEPFMGASILIAVTAIIGATFIQWVASSINSFEVAQLYILDGSYIDTSSRTLFLHIRNPSSVPIAIQMIEIVGFEKIDRFTRFNEGPYLMPIIVDPNSDRVIRIPLLRHYISGVIYQVKVYTATGREYTTIVQAE